ncbi:MAG: cytochrome c oxidase assembly factor Coa1 family protein [Pirellulaceae bacterium]
MSDDINPFSRGSSASNESSQQQYDVAQQNRARQKKSFGIVIAVVLGLFAFGLVCCGGLAFFGYKAGSSMVSAPINAAIAYVSSDEEIADKLGAPIESTSAIGIQNYQNNNGNGGATVGFDAKGPNGTARVDGKLTLTAGTWTVDQLTVKFPDGTSVTLPRVDDAPAENGEANDVADPTASAS